jgi:hypothetical protein
VKEQPWLGAQDQLASWQGSHTPRITNAFFSIGSV